MSELTLLARFQLVVSLFVTVGILECALADDSDQSIHGSAISRPDAITERDDTVRFTLDEARDRAELLHDVYLSVLDVMHERYFHGDRAVVPARAMEDVFRRMERSKHYQSRWIAASLAPMSINHEPKSEFEKHAAGRLARGDDAVETIEDGFYRRAGSVVLTGGCVNCHARTFSSTKDQYAGLIISIPVQPGTLLPEAKE